MQPTDEQTAFIRHRGSHMLVSAAPGSGKTTTSVEYILSLIKEGAPADSILTLMFGRTAEDDFSRKLLQRSGEGSARLPAVKTYHKLGFNFCREFAKRGYMDDAQLETSGRSQEMAALFAIRRVLPAGELKELQGGGTKFVENFISFLDIVKAGILPPEIVFEDREIDDRFRFFIDAFDAFEETRKTERIRYFSDLLYDPVKLLMQREDLRAKIANKKEYILVDEFQDTSAIQYELLKIIAGEKAIVTAVGDVDQSIYEWRGGHPDLMLNQFVKDFPNTKLSTLSKTFRYGHQLAMAANNLIINNTDRIDTICTPAKDTPDTHCEMILNDEPGVAVADIVEKQLQAGESPSELAVLVRLYSASVPVELEFLSRGIPYRLEGGPGCFSLQEIKNLITVLELSSREFDNRTMKEKTAALIALLKFPSPQVKNDILQKAGDLMASAMPGQFARALDNFGGAELPSYQREKIIQRAKVIDSIYRVGGRLGGGSGIAALMTYVSDTNLFSATAKNAFSAQEATETIGNCMAFMSFVSRLAMPASQCLIEIQQIRAQQERTACETDKPRVSIMSIHKAKGLEFNTVLMPGLMAKLFPYENEGQTPDMQSERRLFYVGMTRAKQNLFLIAPQTLSLKHHLSGLETEKDIEDRLDTDASSFLYEANLRHSEEIAAALRDGRTITLPGTANLNLVERYLNGIGRNDKIGIIPAASRASWNHSESSPAP